MVIIGNCKLFELLTRTIWSVARIQGLTAARVRSGDVSGLMSEYACMNECENTTVTQ